jgi:hypothetical protein
MKIFCPQKTQKKNSFHGFSNFPFIVQKLQWMFELSFLHRNFDKLNFFKKI